MFDRHRSQLREPVAARAGGPRDAGRRHAFTPPPRPPSADFSGITGTRALDISQIRHQATLDGGEYGTEAAAGTGVAMTTSGIAFHATLTIDRPYLFLVRDTTTNTILFMGRVADPTPRGESSWNRATHPKHRTRSCDAETA